MHPRLVLLGLLVLALTAAFYEGQEIVYQRRKIRRLVPRPTGRAKGENAFLALAERLLGWYGRGRIHYRLAQAKNPRFIGESPAHFYAAKLILGLVVGLDVGRAGLPFVIYGLMGFMVPDFLIYLGARRRQEEILAEMPVMLDFLRRALAGGTPMHQALAALPERLSGPLRKEVVRLSAHYMLTMDLPRCLDEFANRIDVEEVDHLVLALKQNEVTGRVKTLLARQAEMLKARLAAEEKKGSATRTNFLPLVSVMMVANIVILVAMPLFIQFTSVFRQFSP